MKSFIIPTPKGPRTIGPGNPCFIIAEMSGNHNQNYAKAEAIVRAAAAAGVDAIKLQTYTPDTLTIDSDKKWFMVKGKDQPDAWKGQKLYDLYKTAYTPWEWHAPLQKLATELGLVFFSTPFDATAVDFLENMRVPCYKIASYEATDVLLLRRVAQTGKPVIISVGFAERDEVDLAIQTLRENGAKDIAVLHCVTGYAGEPDIAAMNLVTMRDIRDRYDVVVGFSDNNAGIEVPTIAAALGTSIIEKHVMIDRGDGGPDARFSLNASELTEMVQQIRALERGEFRVDMNDQRVRTIIGTPHYGCQSAEERQNTFFRRSLFVVKDMKAGDAFTPENLRSIRPSAGLPTKHYDEIIGKKAVCDIPRGTPLSWELIV